MLAYLVTTPRCPRVPLPTGWPTAPVSNWRAGVRPAPPVCGALFGFEALHDRLGTCAVNEHRSKAVNEQYATHISELCIRFLGL